MRQMLDPHSTAHVERSWQYLHSGPFASLIELASAHCEPGLAVLEAVSPVVMRVPWRFGDFLFTRVPCERVSDAARRVAKEIERVAPWTEAALQQAAEQGRLDSRLEGNDALLVLRMMIMRVHSLLPLFPVMQALGRDECIHRLVAGGKAYELDSLIG